MGKGRSLLEYALYIIDQLGRYLLQDEDRQGPELDTAKKLDGLLKTFIEEKGDYVASLSGCAGDPQNGFYDENCCRWCQLTLMLRRVMKEVIRLKKKKNFFDTERAVRKRSCDCSGCELEQFMAEINQETNKLKHL